MSSISYSSESGVYECVVIVVVVYEKFSSSSSSDNSSSGYEYFLSNLAVMSKGSF